MYAVVEPYFKSLETGRRMAVLGRDLGLERVELIANKIRNEQELEAVREFARQHALELAGVIPFDEALPQAERAQQAPLDFAPEAPAVHAIEELAQRVVNGNGR